MDEYISIPFQIFPGGDCRHLVQRDDGLLEMVQRVGLSCQTAIVINFPGRHSVLTSGVNIALNLTFTNRLVGLCMENFSAAFKAQEAWNQGVLVGWGDTDRATSARGRARGGVF
jgi:hypothetical protein